MKEILKKIYETVCKIEMAIAVLFLSTSVTVIFIAAVFRTIGMPIRWGFDIALLLFTWSTFLGTDIAFRKKGLVCVDMLVNKLPAKAQWVIGIFVYICVLSAIIFMMYHGTRLTIFTRPRVFNALPTVSHSWATASVPVSMFFMLISCLIQIYEKYFCKNKADSNN
jgi:TRAP-type C4-dicarboxylate transport system permease small subunit